MSSNGTDPPVKIDIGLSAKAEIRTEVPPEASGRFVEALTDLIRPFSEARGLRADQIRLQREEVAIEIAKRARRRLEITGAPIQRVPTKFLVPFLERSSLEADDELLKDKWAALLANTSASADSSSYYALNLLSEMTSEEARFLDELVRITKLASYHDHTAYWTEIHGEILPFLDSFKGMISKDTILTKLEEADLSFILGNINITSFGENNSEKVQRVSVLLQDHLHLLELLTARGILAGREYNTPFRSHPFVSLFVYNFSRFGFGVIKKLL